MIKRLKIVLKKNFTPIYNNEKLKNITTGSLEVIFNITEESKIKILYSNGLKIDTKNEF